MKKILALLCFALPLMVFATQYSLDDLIEYGLEHSIAMLENDAVQQDAEANMRTSWYDFLPNGSINASRTNSEQATFDVLTNTTSYERDWDSGASMSISKSLALNEPTVFNFLRNKNSLASNKKNYEQRSKEVAYEIFTRYIAVLQAQKRLAIAQENLTLQQRFYARVELQHSLGNTSLLDKQQAEVTLIDYQIALNEAQNTLVKSRISLFEYIKMDDAGYECADLALNIGTLDETISDNNNLIAQRFALDNSKLSLIQQYIELYPSLSIGFSYTNAAQSGVFDFGDYEDSYTVSLNASYPIFDFLNKREAYKSTKRAVRLQKMRYEDAQQHLNNQLKTLLADVKNLQKTNDLYQQKLALAQENLRMADTRYQQGTLSLLDYDKVRIDKQSAEISALNSYYSLLQAVENFHLLTSDKLLEKW